MNTSTEEFEKKLYRENHLFAREILNKNSFIFSWNAGAVVPVFNQNYYNGRIGVKIAKFFNDFDEKKILFGKEEYQLTDQLYEELYKYIEKNINKLIEVALNQNNEMIDGVTNTIFIKYNSICLHISTHNANRQEDREYISKFQEEIKRILTSNPKANNDNIN